jgi:hypothetical protein
MLQALDVLTTLVGFACGLNEANPAISYFFPAMGSLVGLVLAKLLMISLVVGFMWYRRIEKWSFVNTCFSLLVIWNSVLILLRLFHVA